jgi:methylated-DNA-[protein]-cysteine S-methyltransferase
MTHTHSRDDAWLHGGPAPDAAAAGLDELLKAGPAPEATLRAQARLRQALKQQGAGRKAQPKTRRAQRAPRPQQPAPAEVWYDRVDRTAIGPVYVAVGPRGLVAVNMGVAEQAFLDEVRKQVGAEPVRSRARAGAAAKQLGDYVAGRRAAFDVPVDLSHVSDFQRRVLLAALQIPRGQVRTYAEVARQIGRPSAARAVGQALGRNPVPIVVPCHRVLAADGSLRGYSGGGGVATKARLLKLEGATPFVGG